MASVLSQTMYILVKEKSGLTNGRMGGYQVQSVEFNQPITIIYQAGSPELQQIQWGHGAGSELAALKCQTCQI